MYHPARGMRADLKRFQAVFVEWTGPECRIVTMAFEIEDDNDALEIAEDMALLLGSELIYLSKC